jgi:hypothetical protein
MHMMINETDFCEAIKPLVPFSRIMLQPKEQQKLFNDVMKTFSPTEKESHIWIDLDRF